MSPHNASPINPTQRIRRDWSHVVFAAGSLFFIIRLLGPGWRQGYPLFFPDSSTFVSIAELGPLSSGFWIGEKPPGLPLVLWILQSNTRALILFQTAVYIASAIFLFHTIRKTVTHRVSAWVGIFLVATVLSHNKFAMWNLEVLSESLLFSTTVFAIAFSIRIAQTPTRRNLHALCVLLIALLFLRDVNVLLALSAIAGIVLCIRRPRFKEHRKQLIQIAGVLTLASLGVFLLQSESHRYQYGVINNVGLRVLTDTPTANDVFDGNTELLKTLEGRVGKNAWDDQSAFLLDPSLQSFREWVNTSGRSQLLMSLLNEPSFWKNQIFSGMRSALTQDFASYDRFSSALRLGTSPINEILPSSPTGLLALLIFVSLTIDVVIRRQQKAGVAPILQALIGISILLFLASVFADAVEVERHSLPPLLMIMLLLSISVGCFTDAVISRLRANSTLSPRRIAMPLSTSVALGSFLVLVAMSFVALEFRTQDWDPSFARTIIERVDRFGGTYYQNGIWHHGPLDALLYDIPRWFTSFGTYWFGVALIVIAMSALVAYSVIRISHFFGTKSSISLALGIGVFLHLTISSSDYAGVIYSRNTTTTILICTFAFVISERPWNSPRVANRSLLLTFAMLGLAVQTMVSAVLTAAVIGCCAFLLHRRDISLRRPLLLTVSSFFVAIASAPAWYLLRGSLREFWANWWVMARYMNTATNRSLVNQFSLGWDKFYEYYKHRPILLIILIVFITLLLRNWRSLTRQMKVVNTSVLMWFVAAWCELAISQRYSSHYFVIPTIPTAIMIVVVVSSLFPTTHAIDRVIQLKTSVFPAVLTSLALLVVQCSDLFWSGAEGLGRFQSISQHQQFVDSTRSGESKTIRAVLDLASSDNDAVLAWTMFPWTYLEHQRVPATRLSWKSFMLGEIYLASTSEKYVLPDTWKWFAADMKQSQPNVYLHPKDIAFVEGTPFSSYVADEFEPAIETEKHTVSLSKRIWAPMTAPVTPNLNSENPIQLTPDNSSALLSPYRCQRIDITISRSQNDPEAPVEFVFQQGSDRAPQSVIRIEAGQVKALANGYPLHSQAFTSPPNDPLPMSIIIGTRSAALIINGRIATAIRLVSPAGVSVSSPNKSVALVQSITSPAPYLNGCS